MVLSIALFLFAANPSFGQSAWSKAGELTRADGMAVPAKDLLGEPLLVQFWTSWCPSCSNALFDIDKFLGQKANLKFAAINITEPASTAFAHIKRHTLFNKFERRIFVESPQILKTALQDANAPFIALFDQHGSEKIRFTGHLNAEDFAKLSQELARPLADNNAAAKETDAKRGKDP